MSDNTSTTITAYRIAWHLISNLNVHGNGLPHRNDQSIIGSVRSLNARYPHLHHYIEPVQVDEDALLCDDNVSTVLSTQHFDNTMSFSSHMVIELRDTDNWFIHETSK